MLWLITVWLAKKLYMEKMNRNRQKETSENRHTGGCILLTKLYYYRDDTIKDAWIYKALYELQVTVNITFYLSFMTVT